ncbi:hypothetical protein [Caballeronia sp. M1242]|uniref:hypothetical protein n=1 Tax=Caballeronia sp. M1242 TaxID=2814653 RepID=UPI0019D24403|nr:hypothetical protein [Caballeronia sp. M1242]QSN64242.1 hypothetical protein JYK05_23355 [Caballeronia sp. M1242]
MNILQPIRDAAIAGAPMTYEWDLFVSRSIHHPLFEEHPRLMKAFMKLSVRAAFALTLAQAEWVAWRFEGIVDISDILHRIEAGYAALVDPRYAVLPTPDEPFPDDLQNAHGPVMLARMLLTSGFEYYRQCDAMDRAQGISMALLARHVCPDNAKFDKWLSEACKRCHAQSPAMDVPLVQQPAVPRELFELADDWDPATASALQDAFVKGLDPDTNPYLVSVARLRQLGVMSTPYSRP